MGKRKSSKVIKKVKREVVAKTFDCPFCNHERSVECKFDKIAETAMLFCRMCKVTYLTTINNLTEPIDVFSEWIDKCAEANDGGTKDKNKRQKTSSGAAAPAPAPATAEEAVYDLYKAT
uniref:Transcription elongation factor 1 homolog n=1 Tax=Prasinoderma singulare TaxID=676789 RepID=A0A7S3F8G6_9VIRI|mmetsp:Transcript_16330/g.50696  ORF Transcript_16330/g.50696 Transcript_16330/m.50696 type:complete len:119 (+) Transcript_16330:86-442(+)